MNASELLMKQGFFDNIDHELLLKAVEKHGPNQWVLFHVEQWLRAPIQEYDGSLSQRTQGAPESIAKQINPQLSGWMNYYGKFYRSEVTQVLFQFERHLRRWA